MFSWSDLPRPITALAPMEDVTDTIFRQLIRRWSLAATGGRSAGPQVMFTEFTRVDGAIHTAAARATGRAGNGRLRYSEAERPLIAQIWGTRPEEFLQAAAAIEELGFDGIDLNMGCPVKKIRKAGACSALIGNPSLAAEIIAACREGSRLPLSIKTRIGLDRPRTEEWCGFLLEQRLDALTVHPRTADQMSEGAADWNEVGRVVALRGPDSPTVILGNGDIADFAQGRELATQSGADGFMVGRGIFADPLLFIDPQQPVEPGLRFPSTRQRLNYLVEHIVEFTSFWGDRRNYEVLKKFFRNYVLPDETLLEHLYATASAAEALAVLAEAGVSPAQRVRDA
ncbi:MAG: tRNA-dihydrouridine synthase family protein [Alkalispirochaeta sp.]